MQISWPWTRFKHLHVVSHELSGQICSAPWHQDLWHKLCCMGPDACNTMVELLPLWCRLVPHRLQFLSVALSALVPESVWAKGSSNSGGLLYIFKSYQILTSSHLHIASPSHRVTFTSYHLHIFTYPLHIFSSSHILFTSSHLHMSFSHLHIFTSSHAFWYANQFQVSRCIQYDIFSLSGYHRGTSKILSCISVSQIQTSFQLLLVAFASCLGRLPWCYVGADCSSKIPSMVFEGATDMYYSHDTCFSTPNCREDHLDKNCAYDNRREVKNNWCSIPKQFCDVTLHRIFRRDFVPNQKRMLL